jgi:hypothetical protein
MTGQLDDEDIQALRTACAIAYEELHRIARETPALPYRVQKQVIEEAEAIMRAWEHIPDTFQVR